MIVPDQNSIRHTSTTGTTMTDLSINSVRNPFTSRDSTSPTGSDASYRCGVMTQFLPEKQGSSRLPALWVVATVLLLMAAAASAFAQERGVAIEGWGGGGLSEMSLTIDRTMQYRDTGAIGNHPYDTIMIGNVRSRVAARGSEYGAGLALRLPITTGLDLRGGLGVIMRSISLRAHEIDRYDALLSGDTTAVEVAWSGSSTQLVAAVSLQIHVPNSGIVMAFGPTARIPVAQSELAPTITYRDVNALPINDERRDEYPGRVSKMVVDPSGPRRSMRVHWGITGTIAYELNLGDHFALVPTLSADVGLSHLYEGSWMQGNRDNPGVDGAALLIERAPCSLHGSLGFMYRF